MVKSLTYFALLDIDKSPGVYKKINNLVNATINLDIEAGKKIYPVSFTGLYLFIKNLLTCESKVIYIRFSDLLFPFIFLILCFLRLKGKRIVVDIPTPRIACIEEMELNIHNPYLKWFRKILSYLSSSWILLPSNLIVQYADEHIWFSYGVRRKTLKMGNGILINKDMPLVNSKEVHNTLNLIAVAQLADWHGYDRLINALDVIGKKNVNVSYKLTIVGDGEALPKLKKLVESLQLKNVFFTGRLVNDALDSVFESAHVGVASLGLYRIGLNEASVLKTREYMSRGLPVVTAGKDPDFSDFCKFRFSVDNSSEIDSLVRCLLALPSDIKELCQNEIREYAISNFSIESKVTAILKAL